MRKTLRKKISFEVDKKSILLAILVFVMAFVLYLRQPKVGVSLSAADVISAPQLYDQLQEKDFTLINVHTPYSGEIVNTDAFIEYDSFVANKSRLPQDKNAKIVLYCQSGNMSAQALQTLKSMGYTNATHLTGGINSWQKSGFELLDLSVLPEKVTPASGFTLPVIWGDIGPRLSELGVIDTEKFGKAVSLNQSQRSILTSGSYDFITIDAQSSQFVVDVLWALGLAQKSIVYTKGPMGTQYADSAGTFASTGGWTLARGNAMDYYNKFEIIPLSSEQQERVMSIAENVFRPCCGNHTAFPDCNHGMAALAAIELMVSQNMPDEQVYKNILKLNSFWFPQTYITAATYFERQGIKWEDADAKMILGSEFSSGKGAAELAQKVGPLPYIKQAAGSCGA